jgi:hypothetical protein
MMFNPSTAEVRRFFCETWRKHQAGEMLSALETLALDWILLHPEYQAELADAESAVARDYQVDDGRTNPFLHLAMHLAIAEQLSVDQPPGIRLAFQKLAARAGDPHAAAHEVMECLGEVVWSAQRAGSATPPDEMSSRYLDCLKRRAFRDTAGH